MVKYLDKLISVIAVNTCVGLAFIGMFYIVGDVVNYLDAERSAPLVTESECILADLASDLVDLHYERDEQGRFILAVLSGNDERVGRAVEAVAGATNNRLSACEVER